MAFILPDMRCGGAEKVALTLISDFIARGYSVDLLLMQAKGEYLSLLPPEVRVVDFKAQRLRGVLRPLTRYFATQKIDSIQAFMWPLTSIAIVAHRLSRSRARLVVSDHTILSRQRTFMHGWRRPVAQSVIRLTYPLADERVIVSQGAASDLAAFGGIDRNSIKVIPNPVDPPPPGSASTPEIEAMWGRCGRRILTVGSLKPEKNHFLLLEAFALLPAALDAKLMLVGDGDLKSALIAHAEALGISQRVIFAGLAIDPQPYYVSADLFALSSDVEGYPLVLVEAMHAGLRIVATDCLSGPAEILDGGRFGTLVPPRSTHALAQAIVARLAEPHNPEAIKERAMNLSKDSFERYAEVMWGTSG